MRTKKDPEIRQEAFIKVATELFMEKGYEAVSVRDVLDTVGNKSSSPSVFYYYFKSKNELYHACSRALAENYIASLSEAYAAEGKSIEEQTLLLVGCIDAYIEHERKMLMTGKSTPNRLFILDMRQQLTERIAALWSRFLTDEAGFLPTDAKRMAQFLTGGIGEMLYVFMQDGAHDPDDALRLTEDIALLVMNTIGIADEKKTAMMDVLKTYHEGRKA